MSIECYLQNFRNCGICDLVCDESTVERFHALSLTHLPQHSFRALPPFIPQVHNRISWELLESDSDTFPFISLSSRDLLRKFLDEFCYNESFRRRLAVNFFFDDRILLSNEFAGTFPKIVDLCYSRNIPLILSPEIHIDTPIHGRFGRAVWNQIFRWVEKCQNAIPTVAMIPEDPDCGRRIRNIRLLLRKMDIQCIGIYSGKQGKSKILVETLNTIRRFDEDIPIFVGGVVHPHRVYQFIKAGATHIICSGWEVEASHQEVVSKDGFIPIKELNDCNCQGCQNNGPKLGNRPIGIQKALRHNAYMLQNLVSEWRERNG